jgi:hypothetical protein
MDVPHELALVSGVSAHLLLLLHLDDVIFDDILGLAFGCTGLDLMGVVGSILEFHHGFEIIILGERVVVVSCVGGEDEWLFDEVVAVCS